MRKNRKITVKFIENNKVDNKLLIEFLAKKYSEKNVVQKS